MLLNRWSAGRGVDSERLDLARKQFEFYAEELRLANPFSSENDAAGGGEGAAVPGAVRRRRARLPVHAGRGGQDQRAGQLQQEVSRLERAWWTTTTWPGPFTKGGWDFMKTALKNADKFFAGERWVLGDYATASVDRAKLEAELRTRYYSDFVTQWRNYFKAASVVRYAGLKDAAEKLNTAVG